MLRSVLGQKDGEKNSNGKLLEMADREAADSDEEAPPQLGDGGEVAAEEAAAPTGIESVITQVTADERPAPPQPYLYIQQQQQQQEQQQAHAGPPQQQADDQTELRSTWKERFRRVPGGERGQRQLAPPVAAALPPPAHAHL